MNYINKGKRDILIFPEFDNIDEIQKIRKKYDELYNKIPPHITIVFPFNSDISNENLKCIIEKSLIGIKPFKIKCKGISIKEDKKVNTYYIFLNIAEGEDILKMINKRMYKNLFNKDVESEYSPHITLGNTNNENEIITLDCEFNTVVDNITVETIGENEESIVEFKLEL